MKKIFAIISLFALVLTSCEKEEAIVIGSGLDTITATIESTTDTKATLQDGTNNNVVLWEEDDPISVFIEQENTVYNVKYELNEGDGTTEGVFVKAEPNFEIAADATILAAVYPYDEDAVYADGSVTGLSTTDSYTYSQTEKVGPMAAKANGSNLSFKNVGALVQISTSNVPNGYNKIELSSATSSLQGEYSLSFDENGIPVPTLTGTGKTITFEGTSADQTVYFPVFAGSYSDLTVKAKGTDKPDITLIAPKALTAVRNTIHYTNREVNTLTNSLVELETNGGKELSIVIESDDETITVKEESDASVTGNVNILINEGALAQNQTRNLIINLPQATVLLSGNTEYTSITSTTASNTLILGNGVIVMNVEVKKGNIQVNTGATLNGISFSNEQGAATSVNIIKNGGTVNVTESSNIIVNESIGEYELIQEAKAGGTYTLTGNVTLSEILTIDKNFVLDGNEFTLTSTADRAINVDCSGNVIIKNLTIITTSSGYSNSNTERAINVIQQAVNLTLDNVNATGFKYTINVAKSSVGSNITISGGEYSGYAAMNITGNNTVVEATDVTFNGINDAALNESNNYAVISIGDAQDPEVTENVTLKITDGTLNASSENGNRQAAIQLSDATNVDISVDAELSLCNEFVLFNELSAGTVSFRNDYQDELIAQGYITTATDNNMFDVLFVTVSNAEDLSAAVNNGGNVVLLDDITLSELVSIDAPTYLNLNNKTVTANCKKAFEVHADATINYGKIVSQQRCVDTRKAVKLTLYDLDLESKVYYGAHGNQQPLTIGGSENGTIVNMHKVNIDAGTTGYGIISFVKTTLTAAESEISGYSALYVKPGSAESEFNFSKSLLSGTTGNNDVEDNSFSTIAVRDNNVNLTLDSESTLESLGNCHFALSFGGNYTGEESTSGVVATVAGTITANNILSVESVNTNNIYVKSDYSDQLLTAVFTTTAAGNGLIKVTVTGQ
ncbi:MAG: hypothetical protein IJN06_04150 [Bacteroidales bacterium]|nr:hypothetical protein [Bacteroidales bacterium]